MTLAEQAVIGVQPQVTDLMTTNETSELLHVPVATLRWWRHNGTGPRSFKLGARKVMYRRADVLTWLESQYAAEQEVG